MGNVSNNEDDLAFEAPINNGKILNIENVLN